MGKRQEKWLAISCDNVKTSLQEPHSLLAVRPAPPAWHVALHLAAMLLPFEQSERQVAQRGHDVGAVAPLVPGDARDVFTQRDIAPVIYAFLLRPYALSSDGLEEGAKPYIDSDITITSAPDSLRGATFLRSSHQDRTKSDYNSSSQRERFLRFTPARDWDVYLAFDETIERRGELTTERPLWIAAWEPTGEHLTTSFAGGRRMTIYRRFCRAGEEVILGGNYGLRKIWTQGEKSMYFLIFGGSSARDER